MWISRSILDLLFFINLQIWFYLTLKSRKVSKMHPIRVVDCRIRSREILRAKKIKEHLFVGTDQGYPKERIKQKIKNVHNKYRDLAIGVKGIQYKSFQCGQNRGYIFIIKIILIFLKFGTLYKSYYMRAGIINISINVRKSVLQAIHNF